MARADLWFELIWPMVKITLDIASLWHYNRRGALYFDLALALWRQETCAF